MQELAKWLMLLIAVAFCVGALYLMLSTVIKGPRRFMWMTIVVTTVLGLSVGLALVGVQSPERVFGMSVWKLVVGAFASIAGIIAFMATLRLVFFRADSPGARRESKWILGITTFAALAAGVGAYLID